MRIRVIPAGGRRAAPTHHLADAEMVLDELGIVVTGLSIWKRRDGGPGASVTLPGKPVRRQPEGGERKDGEQKDDYFNFIRPVDRGGDGVKKLKQAVLLAFREQCPAEALRAEADETSAGTGGQ